MSWSPRVSYVESGGAYTGAGTAVAYRLIVFYVTSDPRLCDEYRRQKAMQPLSPRFIIVTDFLNSSRSNLNKKKFLRTRGSPSS